MSGWSHTFKTTGVNDEDCCAGLQYPINSQCGSRNRWSPAVVGYRAKGRRARFRHQWGELLFAALATCFCNDLYRGAVKCGIEVQEVKVEVTGTFENPGARTRHQLPRLGAC